MTHVSSQEVLDRTIESYHVLGKERDREQRWIGADIIVNVPPIGRFFLTIVTKSHFAAEHLQEALDTDITKLEKAVYGDTADKEIVEPFVLNDDIITDEILEEKFAGRIIKQDLYRSMTLADTEE